MKHEILQGRQVILVGDLNIAHYPIDHCDPVQSMKDYGIGQFHEQPARKWLTDFMEENQLVDVYRALHPDSKGAYTCWNTQICARESNYGTRIDYIICSKTLLPWIKSCTIHSGIYGSDHCPVSVEFVHELPGSDSSSLISLMKRTETEAVPPICTKNWSVFSKRQEKISRFLQVKSKETQFEPALHITQSESAIRSAQSETAIVSTQSETTILSTQAPELSVPLTPNRPKKQKNLIDFFKSTTDKDEIGIHSKSTNPKEIMAASSAIDSRSSPKCNSSLNSTLNSTTDETSRYEYPMSSVYRETFQSFGNTEIVKDTFKKLLTPKNAPFCHHGQEAKFFIVNKQGPNKGKGFYLCNRPVGSGYKENGKLEHNKSAIDMNSFEKAQSEDSVFKRRKLNEFRCDFFQWANKR